MGLAITRDRFEEVEYRRFQERLDRNLEALATLLDVPGFGEGPDSIGAELEFSLVDAEGRVSCVSEAVLGDLHDERFTAELDRFNVECNTNPHLLGPGAFGELRRELDDCLEHVAQVAVRHGARVALFGIVPTLRRSDLGSSAMTDVPRYRALSAGLRRLRRGAFQLRISGEEPLALECDDVTVEGANTSLQVHLRVAPARFARVYNAMQLVTAPALAVSGNSPTFLGHHLWEETRIALFKQSVDTRSDSERHAHRVPRVSFGTRWLERSALELFRESVQLHEPLIPLIDDEDSLQRVSAGFAPRLSELRLHHGTVWRWNRAVYDPTDRGHLRIEMRSLPSGPTTTDMLAGAAFALGATLELAEDPARYALPFERAQANFYRAARRGLDAELYWSVAPGGLVSARELVSELVPVACRGLARVGVDSVEAVRLLAPVSARARSGQTGAVWQRRTLRALEARHGRERALLELVQRYLARSSRGVPVHEWD